MQRPRLSVLLSAGASPVLLIGGWTLAASRQPVSYNSVRDTISALAARGAVDRWVMTTALAALGATYVLTAIGLRPARRTGRLLLGIGGIATLLVAAFPQPAHGSSSAHTVAASFSFGALALWPALAGDRDERVPLLRAPATYAASGVLVVLVLWFAAALGGDHRGLAERVAAAAEAMWPLAVAVSTRLAGPSG